jgi:hypothetical protein
MENMKIFTIIFVISFLIQVSDVSILSFPTSLMYIFFVQIYLVDVLVQPRCVGDVKFLCESLSSFLSSHYSL